MKTFEIKFTEKTKHGKETIPVVWPIKAETEEKAKQIAHDRIKKKEEKKNGKDKTNKIRNIEVKEIK